MLRLAHRRTSAPLQGKVRLAKWYTTMSQKERAKIVREITPMVITRPLKLCNFLDWKDMKVVYKRYASLYFVAGVDAGAGRVCRRVVAAGSCRAQPAEARPGVSLPSPPLT